LSLFHILTCSVSDEIALYDRQIRLWGVQAQEKIRNANILLITMKALANEVAKNLVLAGIGSLTIIDHEPVNETDLGAQFFVSAADVGKNRAEAAAPQVRRLNPRVNVIVDTEDITLKGPSYFQSFDIVIATDLRPDTLNIINTATRVNHKPFYAAGVHGLYGFIFSDLIQHDYVIEREKGNRETLIQPETRTRSVIDVKTKKENGKMVEMVTKREVYSTWFLASDVATLPADYLKSRRRLKAVTPILSCLRALWEFEQLQNGRIPGHDHASLALFTRLATQKHQALGLPAETLRSEVLRRFMGNVGSELAPVTAVLGGQLAQDVINVLGHRQQPIQNLVVFDGDSNEAPMYVLHPDGALGEGLLPFSTSVGMVENGGMANGAGVEPNGQSFFTMPGEVET
jgi:ubiquitin-like 1-activating enzyme E1 A